MRDLIIEALDEAGHEVTISENPLDFLTVNDDQLPAIARCSWSNFNFLRDYLESPLAGLNLEDENEVLADLREMAAAAKRSDMVPAYLQYLKIEQHIKREALFIPLFTPMTQMILQGFVNSAPEERPLMALPPRTETLLCFEN